MTEYEEVKDSGTRQKFKTGAVRDIQCGKGRYDLISPIVLRRLAKHYENGARKYGDRNWEKGIPITRFLDSALRHLNEWREGYREEDHLSAALWNIACIIHTEEMIERGLLPKELADGVTNYLPQPKPDMIVTPFPVIDFGPYAKAMGKMKKEILQNAYKGSKRKKKT
jgi:hypothetical protein